MGGCVLDSNETLDSKIGSWGKGRVNLDLKVWRTCENHMYFSKHKLYVYQISEIIQSVRWINHYFRPVVLSMVSFSVF